MNHEPLPTMVKAPDGAFVWSTTRGWVADPESYDEARLEGGIVLEADDDGWVRSVEGEASLATLMRVDADLYALYVEFNRLCDVLLDIIEDAR